MPQDLLNNLNEYQMQAVTDNSPACLVNANVGSGKTTVLIAKVFYLYEQKKIPLENMVVLTFTNKAANEIKARIRAANNTLTDDQMVYSNQAALCCTSTMGNSLIGRIRN